MPTSFEKSRGRESRHRRPGAAHLRRAVQRALRRQPDQRFPSMDALLAALARSPWSRWRRALALAGLTALLAGLVMAHHVHTRRLRRPCEGSAARFAAVWSPTRQRLVRAAFRRGGSRGAQAAFARVRERFEALRVAWGSARTDACEATIRGPQSEALRDLRLECLDWQLARADALASVLEHADGSTLTQAPAAAERTLTLDECAPGAVLTKRPRAPRDPARRAQFDALRAQVLEATLLADAGRPREALGFAREAADRARTLDHRAVEAEALVALGSARLKLGDYPGAEDSLWRATEQAETAGHDEAGAAAWSGLVFVIAQGTGRSPWRLDLAERCGAQAAAVIERLGGHPRLAAELSHHLGVLAIDRGRFPEAQAQFERALAFWGDAPARRLLRDAPLHGLAYALAAQGRLTAAVATLERAGAELEELDPEHPGLRYHLISLARAQAALGRHDQALANSRRALALTEATVGKREHPLAGWALMTMGESLAATGRLDEGLARGREARAILQATLGAEHPDVALAAEGVAHALRRQGRWAEALAEQGGALAVLEGSVAPDHPDLGRGLHALGETLL
ncbi:MAG TPA: tetratricopeptide repeat protein, partial [Polyangia bacterium]